MKKKASKMKDECCQMDCCDTPMPHPYGRGKALLSVALGLLLITFGSNFIDMQMLALVAGVLFTLKGTLRLMGNW